MMALLLVAMLAGGAVMLAGSAIAFAVDRRRVAYRGRHRRFAG